MRKCLLFFSGLLAVFLLGICSSVMAQDVDQAAAEKKVLGQHGLTLQWIETRKWGTATVSRTEQGLYIKGRQEYNGDYVTLNGRVDVLGPREFTVTGNLETRVSYINGGKPCTREGTFTFKAKGNRKYWRLQEMNNCEGANVLDYVDIYFR